MKALLAVNHSKEKTAVVLPLVLERLKKLQIETCYDPGDLPNADLVITIGGDGTILEWGKAAAKAGKPLLGINTGTLGFMATLEHNELCYLEKLVRGSYRISRRIMLDVSVGGKKYLSLNDVVLKRGADAKLPSFRVSAGGIDVFKIRADGLVFSTPTGSTAYALSAGGPILEPELSCIEFTPLCAHTLFGRSMVFTGEEAIKVVCETPAAESFYVYIDGDEGIETEDARQIEISKSKTYLSLIDIGRNSFYNAVHNKLMRPLK